MKKALLILVISLFTANFALAQTAVATSKSAKVADDIMRDNPNLTMDQVKAVIQVLRNNMTSLCYDFVADKNSPVAPAAAAIGASLAITLLNGLPLLNQKNVESIVKLSVHNPDICGRI